VRSRDCLRREPFVGQGGHLPPASSPRLAGVLGATGASTARTSRHICRWMRPRRCGMTTALEAIREELTTMRQHISCLERAEVIIRPVYEPTEPPRFTTPTPPPAKPTPTRRRRPTCRNRSGAELREYVVAHGPLTRGELVAALGGNAHAMDQSLARLLAAGKIAADGRPRELRIALHTWRRSCPRPPCPQRRRQHMRRPSGASTRCTTRSSTWTVPARSS
jgi:hypothetical protein